MPYRQKSTVAGNGDLTQKEGTLGGLDGKRCDEKFIVDFADRTSRRGGVSKFMLSFRRVRLRIERQRFVGAVADRCAYRGPFQDQDARVIKGSHLF